MPGRMEFYFDFVSPYSYLATTQFVALRAAAAEIVHKPFRLLDLMKLVGNRPTTVECQNKSKYARVDLARWAARYGVPYHRNPHMRAIDHDGLRRAALVAIDQGRGDAAVLAIFRTLWAREANLAEPATLAALLDEAGLDGAGDRAGGDAGIRPEARNRHAGSG